jgi:hypothetical protein
MFYLIELKLIIDQKEIKISELNVSSKLNSNRICPDATSKIFE